MDEQFGAHDRIRPSRWGLVLLLLAGCDSLGTTKKFSHPVMPPPPRERLIAKEGPRQRPGGRIAARDSSNNGRSGNGHASLASEPASDSNGQQSTPGSSPADRSGVSRSVADRGNAGQEVDETLAADDPQIELVSGSEPADELRSNAVGGGDLHRARSPAGELAAIQSSTEIEGAGTIVGKGEVAALVNGSPIFYEDILLPFAGGLKQAEQQMPAAEYRRQRNALAAKHIQPHIEQELLLHKLRTKLKDDQLTQIKKHIDAQFDEELHTTMKKVGVSTPGELEIKLRSSGSSIETLRTNFRNRHLAQQYLATRAVPKGGFDRPDVYEHFKNNPDKFAIPGRVKWQQIHLVFSRHGGKSGTRKLADEILQKLENGDDFAELARQYSDGPTARQGGFWDWTTENSLKSKELDEALFGMPIGGEFARIDDSDSTDIVVVLDRQEAGSKTFASVQTDIKNELKTAEFHRTVKELIHELAEEATIENYTTH